MNIAKVKNFNMSNGSGIGVSVYVSGCRFRCPGCFNSEAWDFSCGKPLDKKLMTEIEQKMGNPNIDHLSVLGGEPLDPDNVQGTKHIIQRIRQLYPEKKVWLWTGYEKDELSESQMKTAELCDFVTFGRFEESRKNIRRLYSGSDNQYTIEMKTKKIKEDRRHD